MKLFKSLVLATAAILISSTGLLAQMQQQAPQMPDLPTSSEVSDDEIAKLVDTIYDLEPIQMDAQEKIQEALEEENITIERFQQMMMAMQNPQIADEVDITEEEMSKLQTIQPALVEIQGNADREMTEKIEENGFTMERYRSIVMGAQQDPELMARIEALLEEEGLGEEEEG
tara:strand:- start:2617 stop:3132 length:516 start_codon:yes stop_codon:yes gene_type:complete